MKLFLVRHGQTDWNQKGLIQGLTDVPLNGIGIEQAHVVRQELLNQGIEFDVCYSSPLQRAYQTAQIIIGGTCGIITNKLIIERSFGELEKNGTDPHALGLDVYSRIENTNAYGIEPIRQMLGRTKDFLNYICTRHDANSIILIVTHGALLHALTANIVGYDDNTDFHQFHYDNCEIREYNI